MTLRDLVTKSRSCRRFQEAARIPRPLLLELVDLARLSPSGANLQPNKFCIITEQDACGRLFPCLGWAAYLPQWPGPGPGERPPAYIIILHDEDISPFSGCDHGIAAQTILLGGTERSLACCILGSFNKERLSVELGLRPSLRPVLVIAIGRPAETIVIEPLPENGDVRYWRDEQGVHHVPKRSLEDIVVCP